MGINLEYLTLLHILKKEKNLTGESVAEFGAQDISADFTDMQKHSNRFELLPDNLSKIDTASVLYKSLGYKKYQAIDASGEHGALVFDLNKDIVTTYNYSEKYDLVTNLGTIEHCFNASQAFINMHNLCKVGGIMIHAFPSAGNSNHGFYNFQPRLFALMAKSNNYEMIKYLFTVDYRPILRVFSHKHYRTYDDRDLMCYVVFRKTEERDFVFPFDSMFDDINKLSGYGNCIGIEEFRPYIKGKWGNIKPSSLSKVSTSPKIKENVVRKICKSFFEKIYRNL